MLTRRVLGILAAVLAPAIAIVVVAAPAGAGEANCHWVGEEYVCEVENPGSPGGGSGGGSGGGGGGGNAVCTYEGRDYPCWQNGWGWFNEQDGCYYILESPQPPAGDEAWEGHDPGDGAVWRRRCFGDVFGELVWRATPPPGQPGTMTPAQLAERAIANMNLRGADIGIVPEPTGRGLVGMPVWLWTDVTPTTWGPITITASVPGLSVTARARATRIVWRMGDGSAPIVCTKPGTPYKQSYGVRQSPDCGYRGYTKPSREAPGGRYTVTATTTWAIEWWVAGGGANGSETATRNSSTTVRIDDLKVITS